MDKTRITDMQVHHWREVADIYREGIQTGQATFEITVPTWADWDQGHLASCRLVAIVGEHVKGWAALSGVSGRCVYAGVAEVSVYVAAVARGEGIGKALLTALVQAAETNGIWTLQAGILRENESSLALHRACGFREVGYRERLGQLHGVWRDVILMERRSSIVGL